MEKQGTAQALWIGILFGLLVITAPSWLMNDHQKSSYDAPWIYPGDLPRH
ncbi:MAG TPA: hypothetical protein V6C81_14355 [Planktothrix sp.]|jgi:hypothetical protein